MLDRSASISLARPVSISSAPAPTVTMTAAGTPILATCNPRPRRPAAPGRRADQGARWPTASLTDPCHARKSSSASPSGGAAGATGALSGAVADDRGGPGAGAAPND